MKKWYQSKTIWVNVLTTILAVIAVVQKDFPVVDYMPILTAVAAGVNIALRLITNKAIE